MKIILEPTNFNHYDSKYHNVRVEIKHKSDDLTIGEFFQLIKSAALAWGYDPDNIKEYFDSNPVIK